MRLYWCKSLSAITCTAPVSIPIRQPRFCGLSLLTSPFVIPSQPSFQPLPAPAKLQMPCSTMSRMGVTRQFLLQVKIKAAIQNLCFTFLFQPSSTRWWLELSCATTKWAEKVTLCKTSLLPLDFSHALTFVNNLFYGVSAPNVSAQPFSESEKDCLSRVVVYAHIKTKPVKTWSNPPTFETVQNATNRWNGILQPLLVSLRRSWRT